MNSLFFGNILFHIVLMAIFLTIFFFTVASKMEASIVKNQVNFVIDDIIGNTFQFIQSKSEKEILIKNLNSKLPSPEELKTVDESVKQSNNKAYHKAIKFLALVSSVIISILIIMTFIFKWNFENIKFIFISGIIGLIFVAITEFMFLTLIAKNYISADPNLIRSEIIRTVVCNSDPSFKKCKK
tara:strand:- start:2927 stop:3478 length:552 start_codon:yes stop_codon:yes gene_type:complete